MAEVFLARALEGPARGQRVVVKRVHEHLADSDELRDMFAREGALAMQLHHPNIVRVIDVGEEEGVPFLAMEWLDGVDLRVAIGAAMQRGTRLYPAHACVIAAGIAAGLHHAHTLVDSNGQPLGIVHRDVSPQNVLVSFAGMAKIADFGIAKAAGRMHSTGDGSAKGKLSYMAPEQVNMQPVTPRTDVFAAGIVLWECLTREKLIGGNSAAERLRALLELDVAPPSSIVRGIPPALDAVVMRALERDPEKRFPTAKAMAAELQRAVPPASSIEVADWVRETLPQHVRERDAALTAFQRLVAPSTSVPTSTGAFQPPPSSSAHAVPAPVSSQRLPASSQGETSAGNHAINDYLSHSEKNAIPARMPRPVLAALIALPALGVIGVVLVLLVVTRTKPPPQTTVVAHADPPAVSSSPAAVAPTATGSIDSEEPTPTTTTPTASTTATTVAVVAPVKPKTTASPPPAGGTAKSGNAGKKCRIVAKPDASGRMKFEEVCTP